MTESFTQYLYIPFDSSFEGHLKTNPVRTDLKQLSDGETAFRDKKTKIWYIPAKEASRMLNNDYNCLPTFNSDKSVTFTTNIIPIIECVGYRKHAIIYGDYTNTVINEEHYF